MKITLYENSKAQGFVELIDYLGSDGLTSVNAARASFGIESQKLDHKDEKLLKYCMREKHTSVFEHNVVTFRFKVPLFVARQHMRHRTWSFNEISRRYTSVNREYYLPQTGFRTQHKTNRQASNDDLIDPAVKQIYGEYSIWQTSATDALQKHVQLSEALYENMIQSGICREQARMILPQNLYTTYWGTVNFNNLIKFIELRTHEGAQQEIQEVGNACQKILEEIWPITMATYKESKSK